MEPHTQNTQKTRNIRTLVLTLLSTDWAQTNCICSARGAVYCWLPAGTVTHTGSRRATHQRSLCLCSVLSWAVEVGLKIQGDLHLARSHTHCSSGSGCDLQDHQTAAAETSSSGHAWWEGRTNYYPSKVVAPGSGSD